MTNNSKKIAIIYTGETRTIESTISTFKKNILINDNYHVFAILQTSDTEQTKSLLEKYIGNHLKCYANFNKFDICWHSIQSNLLTIMSKNKHNSSNIIQRLDYLRKSGSMIEYYQMFLAYQHIVDKEYSESFKYDFIIRIRCDVIISNPIYFEWDDFDDSTVKQRLEKIKQLKNYDKINSLEVLNIFMNSVFYENRINSECLSSSSTIVPSSELNNLFTITDDDLFVNKLNAYLKKGKYIIKLRDNVVYVIKRKYFTSISSLGVTYGMYYMKNNDYWWNSENQLNQICFENDIDNFNSVSLLEEQSLYEYNEKNYYSDNGELIMKDEIFFFIKRN